MPQNRVSDTTNHEQCTPIIMGHNNPLEPTLILKMRIKVGHINFQFTLIFSRKLAWATSMWVINLFCAMFVLQLIFNVLDGSLLEDLEKDLDFWNHINFT